MNKNYYYINPKNLNHFWWYIDSLPQKETVFFWKQSMSDVNAHIGVKSPFDNEPKRYIVFTEEVITHVADLMDSEDEVYFINTEKTYNKKSEKTKFSDSKISLLKTDFKGLQDSFFKDLKDDNKREMREFLELYGNENPMRIKEYLEDKESVFLYNTEYDHRLGIKLIQSFGSIKYLRYWYVLDVKTLYAFFYNANDMSITGSYKVLTGGQRSNGMCPALWYYYNLFMCVYGKKFKYSLKLSLKLFSTWVYTCTNITNEPYKDGWKKWKMVYFFQPSDESIELFYALLD